jgi:hypothetical protein
LVATADILIGWIPFSINAMELVLQFVCRLRHTGFSWYKMTRAIADEKKGVVSPLLQIVLNQNFFAHRNVL